MAIIKGVLEILQMAAGQNATSFNDFARISINGKRISSATVSKRLNELTALKAIDEIIVRSHSGRRVIAYRTTEKGKKIIKLASDLQDALSAPNAKR